MKQVFVPIYSYFQKHRWLPFLLFSICLVVSAFFAFHIRFEEDIAKILPKDKKVDKLNQIFTQSKFMDRLVVMVSLKDSTKINPDSLVEFADVFTEQIQNQLTPFISKINYKADDGTTLDLFHIINEHLPIYFTENDYSVIDSLIAPETIRHTLERNISILSSPAGLAFKNMISNDPTGISFIALKKLQQLQYDENFDLFDNAVLTKDHKYLLFFITPRFPPNNTGQNIRFLNRLDSLIINQTKLTFPDINVDYFGATAVSAGNALQLQKDTLFTQTATIVFLIIFIGVYFRRVTAPLVILIPVVFGALFALMSVYFIKGSISVIAIGTGSVILGIAVNYSLHVFNHFRHTDDMRKVVQDLAFPLTLGGFTTIGGFFCLNFAASDMLKDLGLFAGFSLIGASLCSLIFLPHFISKKKKENSADIHNPSWIDKIAARRLDRNRMVMAGIVLLTIILLYSSGRVSFETDMNNMNFMPDHLKQSEAKLNQINKAALQSVYLVAEGKTLNDALKVNENLTRKVERYKSDGLISKYSGVSSLLISKELQKKRIERWNNYWTDRKKLQLLTVMKQQGAALGYSATAFISFETLLNKIFVPADSAETAKIRKTLLNDFITEMPDKTTVVTLLNVASENRKAVYQAFDNLPDATVLDKQYLTGKFVELINIDFTKIAFITSLLVFFTLLITYGRIELALMAFLPMAISWVWILGFMGLAGIKFNIINIIVSTLIFGLGDDYSIFIMDGLLQEYKTGKKNLSSFKSSILLSAITTITGLGVLIFAKHPALKSIALISIIGILCVVLVAQVLIPFLFDFLIRKRTQQRLFPWTFWGICKTLFSQLWFITGSLILGFCGLILVRINPFNREKGKYIFHVLISRFSRSLIYIMGNVKKKIINPLGEDFSKPALIICNHQSGLDNFVMMMQYPKIIVLTNERVRNALVSGAIVRMADYYSASDGGEGNLAQMKKKVQQGYSIVVFPEGTRSFDGTIKRFHKGAFYLAEQLQLDLLPILIHGTGYTMTKGDVLIKDGRITIRFLPRITPANVQFGASYTERAKQIGRYFREEYEQLRSSIETPSWFRSQLFHNYIYKGPVLEWYMRVKVRLEKDYQTFHQLLPQKGKLLDIGCGYGFMSYMLHFSAKERNITGIDYDEEKIEVANHCFSRDNQINFFSIDILNFSFEKYDGIIVSDVLHYLNPGQQEVIIKSCMHSLSDKGKLIIRDGDKELSAKHKGTRLTELFSTKLLGFNKTSSSGLSFLAGSSIVNLARENGFECRKIDETKYTSNVIFVIQKLKNA